MTRSFVAMEAAYRRRFVEAVIGYSSDADGLMKYGGKVFISALADIRLIASFVSDRVVLKAIIHSSPETVITFEEFICFDAPCRSLRSPCQ